MLIIQPSDSLAHYKLINDNSNNKDIKNNRDNTYNKTNNEIVIIITLKGYYEIYYIYK